MGKGVAEIHVPIKHKQPHQPIHTPPPTDINSPITTHTTAPTLKLKSRKLEDRKFQNSKIHQMKQNFNLIVSEKLHI